MKDQFDTLLPRLFHRVEQVCESEWRAVEPRMTLRQFDVAMAVLDNEGQNQTAVVGATSIDRSTVADVARRMRSKGLLVRRRTKEDQRAYAVSLTDQGRRLARQAAAKVERVSEAILEPLTGVERKQLRHMLKKIIAAHEARSAQLTKPGGLKAA